MTANVAFSIFSLVISIDNVSDEISLGLNNFIEKQCFVLAWGF